MRRISKRRANKRRKAYVALALLSIVAAGSLVGIGVRMYQRMQAAQRLTLLQAQASLAAGETEPAVIPIVLAERDETGSANEDVCWACSPTAVDPETLKQLYAQNEDFLGWLRIPGTTIDYPVMHTPDRPQYYLRKDFSGAHASGGLPFLDERCDRNGLRTNWIIYGHNMKNGSMFAALNKYKEESFYTAHRIITLDTMDQSGVYRVASVFLSDLSDPSAFAFYQYPDPADEATFNEYCKNVSDCSLYETGVALNWGDQLVTLVTCSKHVENGRLVVVAKRLSKAA